jgi:hypothetical protein
MYDIIGDIHGHADELRKILSQMEYRSVGDGYRHPDRQAIFVGDFIDRGPKIREVLQIVRAMIDSNSAQAVMGNHEFNAIAYHTKNSEGEFFRKHNERKRKQHAATLEQLNVARLCEAVEWFKTLPVALELDGIRVVHASWQPPDIELIQSHLNETSLFDAPFLATSLDQGSPLFCAIENVLKGPEVDLPEGVGYLDKDGNRRRRIRTKWYTIPPATYQGYAFMGDPSVVPQEDIPADILVSTETYPANAPPLFFGHYWLEGEPTLLAENVACLDYSVAAQGELVAYRWGGEKTLTPSNFVRTR